MNCSISAWILSTLLHVEFYLRFGCTLRCAEIDRSYSVHGPAGSTPMTPLFFPGRIACDLLVPEEVISARPGGGDAPADHSVKRFRLHEDAHVNMNNERSDGCHCCGHVYGHRQITHPPQTPGNGFHEPQPQP